MTVSTSTQGAHGAPLAVADSRWNRLALELQRKPSAFLQVGVLSFYQASFPEGDHQKLEVAVINYGPVIDALPLASRLAELAPRVGEEQQELPKSEKEGFHAFRLSAERALQEKKGVLFEGVRHVLQEFDEARSARVAKKKPRDVENPLVVYLMTDFEKVYNYLTGWISSKAVWVAVHAWGSAPHAVKSLMVNQIEFIFKALASKFEGTELGEEIKAISHCVYQVVDHFFTHSNSRAEYVTFIESAAKFVFSAKDSPDMAQLEVMTLQLLITFSKDLESMEHLRVGLRNGAAKVKEVALEKLN